MLKRLSLRNVGPHRELDLEFGPGVTGILGPNGSGKTTLLDAVRLLLSPSEYRLFGDDKEGGVHLAAGPSELSYAEGDFETEQGVAFTSRYAFRGGRSTLSVAGEKTLTKAGEVAARLAELLGAAPEAVAVASFRPQGGLDDVVVLPEAGRTRLFQQLCGLIHCEAICKALAKRADEDGRFVAAALEFGEDPDALARELGEASLALDSAEAAADVVRKGRLSDEGRRKRERTIELDAAAARSEDARAHALQLVEDSAARQAAAEAAVEAAKAAGVAARARARAVTPEQADAARELLAAAKRAADRAQLLAKLARAVAQAEADAALFPPAEPAALEKLRTQLAELKAERERAEKLVTAFDRDGVAACPVCETPTAKLADRIGAARALLKDGRYAGLQKAAAAAKQRLDADALVAKTRAALAAESAATPAAAPADELRAARAAVAEHEAAKQGLNAAVAGWQAAEAVRKAAAAEAARAAESVRKLAAAGKRQDPSLVARARADLDRDRRDGERLAATLAEAAQLRARRDQLAARLEAGRAAEAKVGRLRRRQAELGFVCEQFHRSRLPAAVIRGTLRRVEPAVNRWLGLFGDPFAVAFAEDLSLEAVKPGLPPHPAKRLSCAQRSVLGLAFWLSVPSGGLLALDEPTASMDAANRAALVSVFARLAATRAVRQILVTTHAEDLSRAFRAVVRLEAP